MNTVPSTLVPQPNFDNLDQHVNDPRDELGRFANLPGFANQQNFQHLNNGLQAVVQGLNHLILAVQANTASVEATFGRIPLQLCNAAASYEAPLRYPVGVNPGNVHPRTKKELAAINVANITATLNAIGLPIPAGANLQAKRQILMDYLGTGMTA